MLVRTPTTCPRNRHTQTSAKPNLRLRTHPPPPLAHPSHPAPILFEPLAQVDLGLLPLLTVLEAVEVVLDAIVLPPLLELGLLLLCLFDTRGACAPAARDGDEAVFVGDGAGVLEEPGALGFERVELGEVGVYAGLQGGGGGVDECEVRFVACMRSVYLCLYFL
jgi:hypothetical protein